MVRATKIIEKGTYISNFDGLVLEPDACKAFLEKADAHSDDPELGRTEYCMIFKFDRRKYGKPCGKWMINANDEPEAVGLKKLFGRLISHWRRHPNLQLVHLAIKGSPYVLVESIKDRQHRRRGGLAFCFITQEPKVIEYRVICQMKAYIIFYPMILRNKAARAN